MAIIKLILTIVLILAVASSSAVLHAHASHSLSSPIKLHSGGGSSSSSSSNITGIPDSGFTLEVQMGLVVGEGEAQPYTYIVFRLFEPNGWPITTTAYLGNLFQEGQLVSLEADGNGWLDPCRIVIMSDDGWKAGKAWYIHWVSVTSAVRGEHNRRTFAVNRWLGPEQMDSFIEIDTCSYDVANKAVA